MLINTSTNPLTALVTILASIGAINWGLIGIFDFNLVSFLFGEVSIITKIVYILVGASGVYQLFTLTKVIVNPSVGSVK